MNDSSPLLVAMAKQWPDPVCELRWRDPWELLVAVICSARTTDAQVNRLMPVLQEHLLGVAAYADCDHRDLALVLRHVPLHQRKARAIVECARTLLARHGGQVPKDLEALAALPGVGRKTAAVVVGNAFGIPAVAADVHVCRILHRWGWIPGPDPLLAERALMARTPPGDWVVICHRLIRLGRTYCKRTNPRCGRCPLRSWCATGQSSPQEPSDSDQRSV